MDKIESWRARFGPGVLGPEKVRLDASLTFVFLRVYAPEEGL